MTAPSRSLPPDALTQRLLANCCFPSPTDAPHYHCAVSGGPDSTALAALAVAAGLNATLWHVDHGLRAGSAAEAKVVARLADWLGCGFQALTVQIEGGGNVEAKARRARYAALPADVATGHTADDQAETVLVNLLRGAAVDGLAAMTPGPRRPLLRLRRRDTWALCELAGLEVIEDPTNNEGRFLRNRVRKELLPLLAELSQRDQIGRAHV